jgi:hypothetical protein
MINYLAIIISAVVGMGIGAFWYSKTLFGDMWIALMRFTPEQIATAKAKGMAKQYIVHFIALLITAYVFAQFSIWFGVTNAMDAITLAFLSWLGFVAATGIAVVLWEGKPMKLYLINMFQVLIAFVAIALIVGLWQ